MSKIERIDWLDSCGPSGWHDPVTNKKGIKIRSVGWVTHETKETLIITGHIQSDFGSHHADIVIPKCSIIRRKVIK